MSKTILVRGLGFVGALASLGCGSATPEVNTPTREASASARAAPPPDASASASAAEAAPSGSAPATTGAVVDCFFARLKN